MRRKYNVAAVGYLVKLLHKNCTFGFQAVNNKAVVDNFVPDIDGCAMLFESELDNLDGTVNARAKSAWGGKEELQRALG